MEAWGWERGGVVRIRGWACGTTILPLLAVGGLAWTMSALMSAWGLDNHATSDARLGARAHHISSNAYWVGLAPLPRKHSPDVQQENMLEKMKNLCVWSCRFLGVFVGARFP